MADSTKRLPTNAAGAWYVDSSCIGCGLCASTAPSIFDMGNESQAHVVLQPDTPVDTALAEQAMSECPVQAIGNDGK